MIQCLLVLVLMLLQQCLWAQPSPALIKLQQIQKDSVTGNPLYAGGGLHYLQPLYQFSKEGNSNKATLPSLIQALGFSGDHPAAAYYNRFAYDSMMDEGYKDVRRYLDTMGKIGLLDARTFILNRAEKEKVVIFNEHILQLQQRAFFYSLLDDFYELGFRYLSLHWLSPLINPNTAPVNKFLGYQVADPIAAELVRKAKELGFVLIAQGDSTITNQKANVQDAVQASKLASILQQDPSARILVLDEGAHISEKPIGDYTPMATVFQRLSGVNPFTIDQTELCEGSSFEYGRYFYEELVKRIPIDQVSVLMRDKEPASLLENDQVDLQIIFPPAKLVRNRASWLTMMGKRKETSVQPAHRELFLVQAYNERETSRYAYANLIPVDQTYLTDRDGYYWLFLPRGLYKLVYRDINYQILSEKRIEVD